MRHYYDIIKNFLKKKIRFRYLLFKNKLKMADAQDKQLQEACKSDELTDENIEAASLNYEGLEEGGRRQAYYSPSVLNPDKTGLLVITYDGKKCTLMPAKKRYFYRLGTKGKAL